MKAGIYKTPNDNYVYVAKDRTIMATTLDPSDWPGHRVRTSEKETLVHFFDVTAVRVSDVPNGTTDHKAALKAYVERHGVVRDAKTGAVLGQLTEPLVMNTAPAEIDMAALRPYQREAIEALRIDTAGTVVIDTESSGYADFAKHLKAGGNERMLCMPPLLGEGYTLGLSAKEVRDADVGVPQHVVHKMVDAYREKYPHLANFLADPAVVVAGSTPLVDADFHELEARVAAVMPKGMNFIPATGSVDALPNINGQRFSVIDEKTFLSAELDNNGKPFDVVGVQKTLDTVVDYEHAKKDLQVLLHLEQAEVIVWVGDDWEIFDLTAYNATMANPPKVLPVLPRGYMEQRAAAYVRNKPFVSANFVGDAKQLVIEEGASPARVKVPVWDELPDAMSPGAEERVALQAVARGLIRLIGKQSKRKHKRAGHRVFWCAPLNSWAWAVKSGGYLP